MKRLWLIVLLVSATFQMVAAHPPSKIILDFNSETHILKVAVNHSVDDTLKHFINMLSVKLNGNEIANQKFLTQFVSADQDAQFLIHDAKPGDEIEVTASCNIFGKKTEKIKLP